VPGVVTTQEMRPCAVILIMLPTVKKPLGKVITPLAAVPCVRDARAAAVSAVPSAMTETSVSCQD
jgi:hypothetical protein